MTALAAYWGFGGGEDAAPLCRDMLAAQAIYARGQPPVLAGLGPVALGRALFEVAPAAVHDRGPVRGGDGTMLLAADIRIDNRAAIAEAAGLDGSHAAGLSDPALLMRLIEQRGLAGIALVVGPFALVLWDNAGQQLVLARDAMGQRPLHYHLGAAFLSAASMPKGLHALRAVPYAPNPDSVADFLALIPETDSTSFFADVHRVRPGEMVRLRPGQAQASRFWSVPTGLLHLARPEDYAEALREQMDRAVARQLAAAQGRIGSHLSGGLDSAAVTATAARQLSPGRLPAFTAVPGHQVAVPSGVIADEGPLAAATAARFANIDHVRVASSHASVVLAADRHFHLYERPVLNPTNALWVDAINDAARARGVSVMLTGQMGNMTISHAGLTLLPALVGRGRWLAASRLARRLSRSGRGAASLAAIAIGPWLPARWWRRLCALSGRDAALTDYTALRLEAATDPGLIGRAAARGLDFAYPPWRDGRAMRQWVCDRVDPGPYHKGTLAGWGIDTRDPTLDRDLVAFCFSVPEEQFILGGVERSLARRAFADRLPPVVLSERRRGLQGADWHVGLSAERQAIAAELDSFDRCAPADRLIDTERLRRMLDDWPSDGWNDHDVQMRYRYALTRGLAAGHFLRRATRSN